METKATRIRPADSTDISILSALIRTSFRDVAERFALTPENCPKHPSNCTDGWIEGDIERGVTYYILEHSGVPVGCVALEEAGPDLFYLERLAVLPEEMRRGFGQTLVEHVLTEAKDLGGKQVSIGIISDQAELKRWYQKMDFTEGETKDFEHLPFRVTFLTRAL